MTRARDNANLSPTIADARMPNLTGDITTVEGAVATTIADDAVTGAKIENNPTIAGNLTVSGDIVPSTPMSHRNMIINGGMQVAQRGTVTVTGSSYGGPDRFTSFISAAAANIVGCLASAKLIVSLTVLGIMSFSTKFSTKLSGEK